MKIISDNATYCRVAQFIGNRKELNEEKLEKLEELTMDGAKAKAILDASRSSMGQYHSLAAKVRYRALNIWLLHSHLVSFRHGHISHRLDKHRELLQSCRVFVRVPPEPAHLPAIQDEPSSPQPVGPNWGSGAS